jgi:hypothetical protein
MDRRNFLKSTTGALTGLLVGGGSTVDALANVAHDPHFYPLFRLPPVPCVGDRMLASLGWNEKDGAHFGGCDTLDAVDHPFPLKEFKCVAVEERNGRHWATFVFNSPTEWARFRVRHDGLSDDGGTQIVLDFCEYYAPKEGEFNMTMPPVLGVKGGFAESYLSFI